MTNADADRPIFHIGYHKTATTWFQVRFYPSVTNGRYIPRRVVQDAFLRPKAFAFDPAAARDAVMSSGDGARALVCEEDLSGALHNGGLGGIFSQEVARRIKAAVPEAMIVVVIRSQPSMVEAAYGQYVRGGGTYSPSRYVDAQRRVRGGGRYWYKKPLFHLDHFDYQPLLDHYAELFGRESVRVFLYEAFRADPRAFAADFAGSLGLEVEPERLDLQSVNASLSARQVAILRKLNLFAGGATVDTRSLAPMLDLQRRWAWLRMLDAPLNAIRPASKRSLLPPPLRAAVTDHFRDKNARLAADWALPLARFGYPLP